MLTRCILAVVVGCLSYCVPTSSRSPQTNLLLQPQNQLGCFIMVEGGKIREREAGRAGSGKTPTWWCELSRYGERCVLGKGWCTSISPFLQPQNLFHPLLITPCCPPDPGLGTEMQDFRFRLWALLQGPQEEHSRDVLMERGPEQSQQAQAMD